jgi:hypothetical protein
VTVIFLTWQALHDALNCAGAESVQAKWDEMFEEKARPARASAAGTGERSRRKVEEKPKKPAKKRTTRKKAAGNKTTTRKKPKAKKKAG